MIWLTWRQFRVQATAVAAVLVVIGVLLAITGPSLAGRTEFSSASALYYGGLIALYVLPALLGVFWGVPMVTRELEAGTHNLVWNQTVTRKRWLTTKLGIGVLAAMVATGLLSLAIGWWASPIDTAASLDADTSFPTRMDPVVFAARGIVPIGYAAFAFVLGVAAGIMVRRTMTAIAVTLVVFAAVQVAVPALVRPYLLPATEESVSITVENIRSINANDAGVPEAITVSSPAGVWLLSNETVDAGGTAVSPLPDAVRGCIPPPPGKGGALPERSQVVPCFAQLSGLGYHQELTYQPGSRFWPLQWLETGLFLVLSALLTWFCFRRLRRLS